MSKQPVYQLSNARSLGVLHPDTFEVPDPLELSSLEIGRFVKLCFNDKERMWVKITEIDGESLKGTLANQPVVVLNLNHGDPIEFSLCHVYDIEAEDLVEDKATR